MVLNPDNFVRLTQDIQIKNEEIAKCAKSLSDLKAFVEKKVPALKLIDDNIALKTYDQEMESLMEDFEEKKQQLSKWMEAECNNYIVFI